jgi:NADH-quinone oxidoreductase subunit M
MADPDGHHLPAARRRACSCRHSATGAAGRATSSRWIALVDDDRHLRPVADPLGLAFRPRNSRFQFVENIPWNWRLRISYRMGVDGISMLFVILTAVLMPLCILASWESVERRAEYMIAFLVLETLMIGVFCALDLVLFYVFFEGGLIPMFLIIGIWGGKRRI